MELREVIKDVAAAKSERTIALHLPHGGMAHVPCEQLPELIIWCWDTAGENDTFTSKARSLGAFGVYDWAAGWQYIGLSASPGKENGVTKGEIARYLVMKLMLA